jgi:predicted DNA-binding transcriptional regulator AlpA
MNIANPSFPVADLRSIESLPELCTRAELAAFTGVSVQTFARWAVEGKGPRQTKLGHASRYKKAHVVEWLEASAA